MQTWADSEPLPRAARESRATCYFKLPLAITSPNLFPCQLFQGLFSLRDVSSFKPGCCFVWTANTTLLLGHSKPHLPLLSGCVRQPQTQREPWVATPPNPFSTFLGAGPSSADREWGPRQTLGNGRFARRSLLSHSIPPVRRSPPSQPHRLDLTAFGTTEAASTSQSLKELRPSHKTDQAKAVKLLLVKG